MERKAIIVDLSKPEKKTIEPKIKVPKKRVITNSKKWEIENLELDA